MNVCFKRIKKIAEVSLSEHTRKWEIYFAFSLTFLCVNFTAINKECFNKNLFLKVSLHSPEKTRVVNIFFYQVTGLQPSGLQNRYFLVNNMTFLRTPILKNTCESLSSVFFKSILCGSWKKTILKIKWQKLINKYENTFIWTLHAAMKRNHWNVSLNLYYRHAQSNSYRVLNLKSILK